MHKTPECLDPGRQGPGFRRPWLAWALILWLPLTGLACSSSGRSEGGDQGSSIEDENYPNLARVPGEQARPTPASLRDELIASLAADRANARYSDEALTGSSAAAPPATPPPAAGTQVEIIWDTLRVEPEASAEEAATSGAGAAATGTAATGTAAGASDTATDTATEGATDGAPEGVQINWETERVEPSGKVTMAGATMVEEELILAPGPELVGVVYFAHDSTQVDSGDLDLLEDVVALYKERGGQLRLVGHSSSQASTGDEVAQRMVNLDLSLQRANAVATTLLDLGADKDKLMIEAKADSEPASGPANIETAVGGESNNRRVEIFLEH